MKSRNYMVIVILVMVVLLCTSLTLNVVQYNGKSASFSIKGTYCTDSDLPSGEYLVFDDNGNYFRYIQVNGVLENGTYVEAEENQFNLLSDCKESSCILLVKDGVYLFSGGNTLTFYSRVSNKLVFLGNSENAPPAWLHLDSNN